VRRLTGQICVWLATSLMCGFNYACLSFL